MVSPRKRALRPLFREYRGAPRKFDKNEWSLRGNRETFRNCFRFLEDVIEKKRSKGNRSFRRIICHRPVFDKTSVKNEKLTHFPPVAREVLKYLYLTIAIASLPRCFNFLVKKLHLDCFRARQSKAPIIRTNPRAGWIIGFTG